MVRWIAVAISMALRGCAQRLGVRFCTSFLWSSAGVLGVESAEVCLTDAPEFFERQSASAAVSRKVELCDFQEGLGAGVEIEQRVSLLVVVW